MRSATANNRNVGAAIRNIRHMRPIASTLIRTGAAITGSLALLVSGAAAAHADLYWASYGSQAIFSSAINGTDPSELIAQIGSNPNQVTYGPDGYLYWANYDVAAIGRAKLDGSEADANWFTSLSEPTGVAVTGTHIYWAEDGNGRVSRAKLDGSEIEANFVTGLTSPHGLAVNGNDLYIANTAAGNIVHVDLTTAEQRVVTHVSDPQLVAANDTHVFWTNFRGESIGRSTVDGNDMEREFIYSSGSWTYGIAVDAEHIYWTNYTGTQSVARANLDGTQIELDFISGQTYATGLTAIPDPTISGITPSTGAPSGGTPITITGTTFFKDSTVTVGGADCVNTVWVSSTVLECTTPAGSLGAAAVVVTNPDTHSVTAADAFSYADTPPDPTKKDQSPVGGCAKAPAAIPNRGTVRLLKANCTTNAGQPVTVQVSSLNKRSLSARGDVTYYRVIRKPNGKTLLKTFGYPVKLKIVWSSAGTDGFQAYKKVRNYR